ncbi:hypothetical protein [Pinirhizobacter sp.]|jgi:hypothetical protein|uniref:hypothetical protein n=1 Tax=Pinirhizobacter sp. TaxID=2950432 RepID=UPI002F414FAB
MPKAAKQAIPSEGDQKSLSARQQAAVDALTSAFLTVKEVADPAPPATPGEAFFGPDFGFVEGQLNTFLWTAHDALKQAIECFADSAEDGVEVPDVTPH